LLETEEGVRVLDFHGNGTKAVRLIRPDSEGVLYLRSVPGELERVVPESHALLDLGRLPLTPARTRERGAAQQAFTHIFELPFDAEVVSGWSHAERVRQSLSATQTRRDDESKAAASVRRVAALAAMGVSLAAAIVAGAVALSAQSLRNVGDEASQRYVERQNERIASRNQLCVGLGIGAAAAGSTGAVLLSWPRSAAQPQPNKAAVGAAVRF
jgi:hypothetical protein